MKEKLKSAVLTILVVASLVQTFILAFGSPKLDQLLPTTYVPSEVGGTQMELAELLIPRQLIIHLGDNQHRVIAANSPQQQFYKMIFHDFLQKRRFEGLRKLSPTSLDELNLNLGRIRNNNPGIEVVFEQALPLASLQRVLNVRADGLDSPADIKRILLYANTATGELDSYFFTEDEDLVYLARTDMDINEVQKNVAFAQYLTPYTPQYLGYYLPDDSIQAVRYKYTYTQFTAEELKRSLFVDPGIVKNLQEKDGSQIYTDAKRGLQLQNDKHWLIYTDPVAAPAASRISAAAGIESAVQFVNQHGGWNGMFRLSKALRSEDKPQQIQFRLYVDHLPLYGIEQEDIGAINLELQQGIVSSYERSLLKLDEEPLDKRLVSLPGGTDLRKLLQTSDHIGSIIDVFPAYQVVIADKSVELIPRWTIELENGSFDFL